MTTALPNGAPLAERLDGNCQVAERKSRRRKSTDEIEQKSACNERFLQSSAFPHSNAMGTSTALGVYRERTPEQACTQPALLAVRGYPAYIRRMMPGSIRAVFA